MQIPPPLEYAERAGASLAFQAFGEGQVKLLVVSDPPSHLDLLWADPSYVNVLLRLAGWARVVMYDRRGIGLSDPLAHVPTLEEEALDLEAVMDAAGWERATVFGYSLSTLEAAYFAATRPERVERLLLLGPFARGWNVDGNRWTPAERESCKQRLEEALDNWGQGRLLDLVVPTLASPRSRRQWGILERASISRGVARATWERAMGSDISSLLPSVQPPTLVLNHHDLPPTTAVVSEVAELIPDATLREIGWAAPPSAIDDLWLPLFAEAEEYLVGTRADAGSHRRVVTTLLFTDIVGSTESAARLGDTRWRTLLVRHDDELRELVEGEGGRVIKNIGDGSLSSFEGPVSAIRCAQRLRAAIAPMGLEIRVGVHTGECERVGLDLAGLAVHVGARVQAAANPGEVLVSRAASELCAGSGLDFTSRGLHELKGLPGRFELLSVTTEDQGAAAPEPTPTASMGDRIVLGLARRAPGLLRGVARRGR